MFLDLIASIKQHHNRNVLRIFPPESFIHAYPDQHPTMAVNIDGAYTVEQRVFGLPFGEPTPPQIQVIGPALTYNDYPLDGTIFSPNAAIKSIGLHLIQIISEGLETDLKLGGGLFCTTDTDDEYIWSRAIQRAIQSQIISEVINDQRAPTAFIMAHYVIPGIITEMGLGTAQRSFNNNTYRLYAPLLSMDFEFIYRSKEEPNIIDADALFYVNNEQRTLDKNGLAELCSEIQDNSPIKQESEKSMASFWERILKRPQADIKMTGPS